VPKKADIILIAALAILAVFALLFPLLNTASGSEAVILVKNEELYRLPLEKDTKIDLGTNIVKIENGEVSVESATCPDKVCVHHSPIKNKSDAIICVPNGVVVEVE
jgi:hypothetical protein